MDAQELSERQAAADAYAGESPKHFVAYLRDCVNLSVDSKTEIRKEWDELWRVFQEEDPPHYAGKEPWQSKTVVPMPFYSIMYAAAAVKKAFSPRYLTVTDDDTQAGTFWKKIIEAQTDVNHGDFPLIFTDASIMALAIGTSMEMIPKFRSGAGLSFDLVEPWKIHRDPDAPPRNPQGGDFWIHQEWLNKWVLLEGEAQGRYQNVERAFSGSGAEPSDGRTSKEEIARRKEMFWSRSSFREAALVSEFWGVVLDPRGELLLPSATYTVAGDQVVSSPKASPYRSLKWPGVQFSFLPSLLGNDGRGTLKSVKKIWWAINNIVSMHEDALNWLINPPSEINVNALVDPEDVEIWPGKSYLTEDTPNGQQAVRQVERRDVTNSVIANVSNHNQYFQKGSFSPDIIQGAPGWRQDQTWRESRMNLENALGVYSLMGANGERGAIAALRAAYETILAFASYDDYMAMIPQEMFMEQSILLGMDAEGNVENLPLLSGGFSVSGMQTLAADQEKIANLREIVMPMADSPIWGGHINTHGAVRSLEGMLNLKDEGVLVYDPQAVGEQSGTVAAAMQAQQAAAQGMAGAGGGGGGGGPQTGTDGQGPPQTEAPEGVPPEVLAAMMEEGA